MGVKGCYKCMKYTLVIFNVIVFAIGAVVLALGIYTLVTDYGVEKMSAIVGNDLYRAGAIMLIVFGSITILISFLGFAGAAMESRVLLGFYFAIMLILFGFFLAICIIGFIFRDNIRGHIKREAEANLINDYGVNSDVTTRWDEVQRELQCCGLTGDLNSNSSWAIYRLESTWYKQINSSNSTSIYNNSTLSNETILVRYVPDSCCMPGNFSTLSWCVGNSTADHLPPVHLPPFNVSSNPAEFLNPYLYTMGCYDKLEDSLINNADIIGGIALAAFIIMLLGMVFSITLCVQINKHGYAV